MVDPTDPGYPVEVVPEFSPFDDIRTAIHVERDRPRSEFRRWGDGTPLPPLFADGHKPRGLVAPVIAYGILGVAGLLAIVGDELLEWSEQRACKRLARRMVDRLGDRRD